MKTSKINNKISFLVDRVSFLVDRATKIALKHVETLARQFMRDCPQYKEFEMSMGTWQFVNKNGDGESPYYCKLPKQVKQLENFIDRWDDELKLTGCPMRFTVNGRIRRNW